MRIRRRGVQQSRTSIDATSTASQAAAGDTDRTPLQEAADASIRAGKVRAALGGYVPLDHRDHPTTWSRERQDALVEADAAVASTTQALLAAVHVANGTE